jgi:hypothetical protein
MKESKFIELLNLYIDQEITPPEAALLEEEIQHSPERRRVYQQYCRMHRASTLVVDSFRSSHVPAGSKLAAAAQAVDEKVVEFPALPSQQPRRWIYASGLVAAAACATFVFLHRPSANNTQMVGGTPVAQSPAAPAKVETTPAPIPVAPVAFVSDVPATPRHEFQTALKFTNLAQPERDAATLTANRTAALEWIQNVQFVPVRLDSPGEIVFVSQPTLRPDPRVIHGPRPVEGKVEWVSVQFQH